MEIRHILFSVARRWKLIVILALSFGALGFYFSVYLSVPIYSSNTILYVLDRDKVAAGETLTPQDLTTSQQLLKQYSGIFYSRTVASAAANRLGDYKISAERLASMVSLSNPVDSNILNISAKSSDPHLAAAAANAMGSEFASQISSLTKSDYIGVLDAAVVPKQPIPNNGMIKVISWMFGGIIIAVGLIYIKEYFDTTIRSKEEIEKDLNVRILGMIPEHDIN